MPTESNPSGEGSRQIVHLQPKEQLAMPLLPGSSGLLLPAPDLRLVNDDCTWTVFRRVGTKGNGGLDCVYLGEYEVKIARQMTKEQFCAQDTKASLRPIGSLGRYFIKMRARIALRKRGTLPAQDPESEEMLVNEEVVKMRKKTGQDPNQDDVLQALRRGDETFDILRMRCMSYDHKFIRHVEAAVAAWKQAKKEAYEDMAQAPPAGAQPLVESLDRRLPSELPQRNAPLEKVE
ncbi:hypothetical protein FA13DRAFT_1785707 [Coprinellus micaceus]|uniref:DUF6697 domain-containing protein n=1 Tax=Coprinellus micaceus TaxID=71717 RepID=A0A4Y7TUG0_COPMI|nr:hypothetical protein FA13DRAFT_1785707 [Coprinellus micaceus]